MPYNSTALGTAGADQGLEGHFRRFRAGIVGQLHRLATPYGEQEMLYADWTASGRLYAPIERIMLEKFGPLVANTHSGSNATGASMTLAYSESLEALKRHVHAAPSDSILVEGFGMTAAVNRFQRILQLRWPEDCLRAARPRDRPLVVVSHMEHHSNYVTWLETIADVVCLPAGGDGLMDLDALVETLRKNRSRPGIFGSFTACSNVTGIATPYHELAKIMHAHGGRCFVDFSASAPYADMDMHPEDPEARLDAVFFSPHKFLGGPGSPGVVVFDRELYPRGAPDRPGGGTVLWVNPWGGRRYHEDIESREEGGTPGFLQTIRAALAVELKNQMGVALIRRRESEITACLMDELSRIPGVHILAAAHRERQGIVSFYFDAVHYNLAVRLLNDRFGIQVRGGCACAGPYGHCLLGIGPEASRAITDAIDQGDLSGKPGWVRVSLHPTMTDAEALRIARAVGEVALRAAAWSVDYRYDARTNEFLHVDCPSPAPSAEIKSWLRQGLHAEAADA